MDAIDRAEDIAKGGDYDRALGVIGSALETYPKSAKLKDAREGIEKRKEGAEKEAEAAIEAATEEVGSKANPPTNAPQNSNDSAAGLADDSYSIPNDGSGEYGAPSSGAVEYVSATGGAINLRAEPSHYSALVTQIGSDTVMQFFGEEGTGYGSDGALHTWYRVRVDGSVWGWARSDLIVAR